MNKTELIDVVAEKTGGTKVAARAAVEGMIEVIGEALAAGQDVSLSGFGAFSVKKRNARPGRNPKTGETMTIPESAVPAFKAGKGLRERVNK